MPTRYVMLFALLLGVLASSISASPVAADGDRNSPPLPTATASNPGNGSLSVGVNIPGAGPGRSSGARGGASRAPAPVLYGSTCGVNGTAACAVPVCPALVLVDQYSCGAPAAPAVVDPYLLALQAQNELTLPAPTLHTAPPPNKLIVEWQIWLWMDADAWRPLSATASAGLVSATVTARPVRVRWEMGDGSTIVCDGPGTPWDPNLPAAQQSPSCSYVYRRSSADQPNASYVVRASIDWSTSWVAVSAAGGGALGPAVTTGVLPVQVGEVQALVTQ